MTRSELIAVLYENEKNENFLASPYNGKLYTKEEFELWPEGQLYSQAICWEIISE